MLLMLLALLMNRSVRLQADLHAAVAAQPPRQIDALLFENQFLRVHLVTLNDVNHFRSTTDAAQVLYCLGSFMVLRDDGSLERCTRGHVLFAACRVGPSRRVSTRLKTWAPRRASRSSSN